VKESEPYQDERRQRKPKGVGAVRKRMIVSVVAGGMAIILASCSSAPTSGGDEGRAEQEDASGFEEVFAELEGLTGQERTDKLIAMAEEEGGELNLYTSMTTDVADEVAGAFDDAYEIEPSTYRADSETVLLRLVEEADAGFKGSDIVETNGTELANLSQEGLLVDYDTPATDGLVEGSDYEGWVADRFNKFVISWNTNAVPETERPKSWEDLADPKWDGQLALEPSDVDWYMTLWNYWADQGKSEDEINGLFEAMADGGLFTKGHTVMGELLAAGEFQIAASNYSYIVQNAIDDGAPIAWEPAAEPILSRPNGIGLVRGAQHPATALLFMEWMLTDGQELLVEFNLDAAREDLATAPNAEEVLVDLDMFIEEQEEWTDRYEQVTSLGKLIEE
jgi:iron(III) transport system substrate-binding protein